MKIKTKSTSDTKNKFLYFKFHMFKYATNSKYNWMKKDKIMEYKEKVRKEERGF